MGFGTNSVFADLAAFPYPVNQFGLNEAFDAIEELWTAQNNQIREQRAEFVDTTTLQFMIMSAPDSETTQELSEYGTPNPQKITPGQQIGFPLRKFGRSWQATFTDMKVMTGKEIAANGLAAATADLRRVQERIRNALYGPLNYLFTDRLVDRRQQYQLPVKALANGDTFPLPVGPNGEIFTNHNHYLATVGASAAQSDWDLLIATVMEHHNSGTPRLIVNQADVGTVRGFIKANGADVFVPDVDARLIQPLTATYTTTPIVTTDLYNRRIGIYNNAEVWVKPWAIAGYPVCYQANINDKPLMLRERMDGSGDMQMVWEGVGHPLNAKVWEREFDIAVYNRIGAAVLDTTHQTNYVMPAIPAA